MHLPYVGFPSWRGLSSQSTVKPLTWVRPWKEFKAKPYSDSCNKTWSSGVLEYSAMHATGHIPEAQCAFKILMIHEVLQFALRIAFRCVLHRCGSLDIRCWKLYVIIDVYGAENYENTSFNDDITAASTLSFVDDHHLDFSCNLYNVWYWVGQDLLLRASLNRFVFVDTSHSRQVATTGLYTSIQVRHHFSSTASSRELRS